MTCMPNTSPDRGLTLDEIIGTRVPERRLVGRILSYWEDKRGERALPTIGDVTAAELGDDWESCFIVDVRPRFKVPAMAFMGERIQHLSGILVSGRMSVVFDVLELAERKLKLVAERAAPVLVQDEFAFSEEERLLARAVLVPLCENEDDVSFVLGAANGKIAPAVAAA